MVCTTINPVLLLHHQIKKKQKNIHQELLSFTLLPHIARPQHLPAGKIILDFF